MTPVSKPGPRALSRLLPAVLLLLAAVLAASPAAAQDQPSVAEPDVESLARTANGVFSGTVTASETLPQAGAGGGQLFTHTVRVGLVYKGDLAAHLTDGDVQVETTTVGACALGRVPTGRPYVFFVRAADGVLSASKCGGTQPKRATLVEELEALYGDGERPASELATTEATIEPVAGMEDPPSFTRTAAPGAALVLIGLLGLFVVRRLARRGSV